jgi:5-bromo-4-chloroindolyl phosphate hydrolysis protein
MEDNLKKKEKKEDNLKKELNYPQKKLKTTYKKIKDDLKKIKSTQINWLRNNCKFTWLYLRVCSEIMSLI